MINIKRMLVLSIVFIIIISVFTYCAQEWIYDVMVYTTDNKITKCPKIDADNYVVGNYKGTKRRYSFTEIKMIEKLDKDTIRIIHKNNNEIILSEAYLYQGIRYIKNDELTGKEIDLAIISTTIKRIDFGNIIGRFKFNTNTDRYYPPDYKYDPYTGEILIPKDLED